MKKGITGSLSYPPSFGKDVDLPLGNLLPLLCAGAEIGQASTPGSRNGITQLPDKEQWDKICWATESKSNHSPLCAL